ncbi:MAG: XrtA/PEP-CTERM system histidine kinase PrsK [Thermodesulfobacteriota bacterium]|nr:XrtA/PEP-CTERM system histidine kinase PrsK [Thermodesulfobacteriota bacterium]
MITLFYTLNAFLLLFGSASIFLRSGEKNFSIALLRILLGLPLLAGEYVYLVYHIETQTVQLVFFSEIIFALLLLCLALHLPIAADTNIKTPHYYCLIEIFVATAATCFLIFRSAPEILESSLPIQEYSFEYCAVIFLLIIVFFTAWRLEQFWRGLRSSQRWEYKFLIIGCLFICGTFAWSTSYRLTYLSFAPRLFLLLASLLFFGWALMAYAIVHHRLLNRKIFVSRKIIYSSVVPSLLAIYFLGFGIVSLIVNTFDLHLSFVLKWLFLVLSLMAIGLFSFSGKIRRRIHFFISTHFYINKYKYRDEWLALSQELQGALTETRVVMALQQVLSESLYTAEIFIWVGDSSKGYRLVSAPDVSDIKKDKYKITANDLLIYFIQSRSHFHLNEREPDSTWKNVANQKKDFLSRLDLTLLSPISIGNHLIGLIGLGPEFTGDQYGYDDFDLLTVLGSQTASALMAVRMAEELAHMREQQAWNRLSSFVLHDIKNASTMLSLLQENAPEHIHEPEFQQDMLELLDDALKRMRRIEQRLMTLENEIIPDMQNIELGHFLETCRRRMEVKLPSITITAECTDAIQIRSDPELLFSIVENLLLNAFEAQKEGTIVKIMTAKDVETRQAVIEIIDNGPGIAEELLPDILFEPFKTSKGGGSGIGLWQVKNVLKNLDGSISAANNPQNGAQFVIRLPLVSGVE